MFCFNNVPVGLQGLGTSTDKEGKEYFSDLDKHKKDFMWVDDNDGNAIELAFSKKKIEARKDWIRQHEVGKCCPFAATFVLPHSDVLSL